MKKNAIISFCLIMLLVIVSIFSYNFYINTKTNDIRAINLKDLEHKEFNLSKEDYIEDFNFAYNTLKEHYPFFEVNKKLYGVDWLSNKEKYEAYIAKSKNDADFFSRMTYVLAELHNGHTHLMPEDFAMHMYVLYYTFPNSSWRHDIAKMYEKDNVRRRYNINNETVKKYVAENIKSDDEVNKTYSKNLMTENIIKDKLAYIRISSLIGEQYINQDKDIVINYLNEIKDYPFLIIDIRGNGGGDSRYWQDFLIPKIIDRKYETKNYLLIKSGKLYEKMFKQLQFKNDVKTFLDNSSFNNDVKKILSDFDGYGISDMSIEPKEDSIHFKGKIYLLVDNGVYSSAEMLASFCKETKLATLVGSRTAGDGIGIDPMQVDLPNTAFVMRFSNVMGLTGSGSINELDQTVPDIIVQESEEDKTGYLENQRIIKAVMRDAGLSK
ncbi:S41 family peptidase [Fenollaria massiliensis]|uniref:S41 family peptidase n=1 Tax=Fenollaria massiliensis TaxID=938288 RepID=A0A9E7DKR3_9FIRM|nr:S41 family peptidase [Fenollaria massiliensis]UQK59775.1 S41 family peptidase [Fenollaria massiliensis]